MSAHFELSFDVPRFRDGAATGFSFRTNLLAIDLFLSLFSEFLASLWHSRAASCGPVDTL